MDKIKPILAHKFWFILGLAIVVGVVGWWWDSGKISETIAKRTEAIKSADSNSNVQGEVPNEDWTAALKGVNATQNQSVVKAEELLFSIQSHQMTWPISVAVLMKNVAYRGKSVAAGGKIDDRPLSRYRLVYQDELHRVWKIADPYDPLEDTGRVQLDQSILPQVQNNLWQNSPPTWKEMWDAQEDLWLLEDILASVANLNKDYRTIRESPVRVIEQLLLKGGSRTADGEPATGGGGMGEEGGEASESAMKGGGGLMSSAMQSGGMGAGGGLGGGGDQSASVTFSPTEVFGSDAGKDAGSEGEGDGASMQEESSGGEGDAMKSSMGAMMGGMGQSNKNAKRYVDNDESRPFKTRGFYLQVIMKHDQLPDLIAELTNSKWPVEILRVQQEDLHKDEIQGTDGGAQASGLGGRSMMPRSAAGAPSGLGAASANPSFGGAESGGLPSLSASGAGGFGASINPFGSEGDATAQPMTGGDQGGGTATLAAARQDRGLVRVAIAGLMTLYSPPPPPAESEMASVDTGTAPQSDGSSNEPSAVDNAPATGGDTTAGAGDTANDSDAADATTTGDATGNTAPDATSPSSPQPESSPAGTEPANKPTGAAADATETPPPTTDEKPPAAEKQPADTKKQPSEATNDKNSQ